jgi:hypothetical protein
MHAYTRYISYVLTSSKLESTTAATSAFRLEGLTVGACIQYNDTVCTDDSYERPMTERAE